MSSSIEEQFQPPEWSTKEEVIKAAQHYINYWKVEARHSNSQWLTAMERARLAGIEIQRLRKELADAQENYHTVNEMVAKMLKEGKPSV